MSRNITFLCRSKRQNKQKRRDNATTTHQHDNEESQLPSTSTTRVDKELEIPESQSEIGEVTNKCDQMMTFRYNFPFILFIS